MAYLMTSGDSGPGTPLQHIGLLCYLQDKLVSLKAGRTSAFDSDDQIKIMEGGDRFFNRVVKAKNPTGHRLHC